MGEIKEESVVSYPYDLCHYGVKGMKWGIRRHKSRTKSSKKSNQRDKGIKNQSGQKKSSSSSIAKAKDFLNKNGKNIAITALKAAPIALGMAFLTHVTSQPIAVDMTEAISPLDSETRQRLNDIRSFQKMLDEYSS